MTAQNNNEDSKLIGLMAQFDDPHSLVNACDQARQAGYTQMDAYSPFPVHGIDPAIGIKRTKLPFICLGIGLFACALAVGLQWYTNATDTSPMFPGYRFNIGGKPYFSLPANIPVVFEIIVLLSAFGAFFGMWMLNKLPMFANPLHRISRFKRATNDRFFLVIEAQDPQFDRSGVEARFNEWGATAIEEVREDLTDQKLPAFMKLVPWIVIPLLLAPPVLIYRAMGQTSRYPRLHVVPDMDWQDKYKAQSVGPDLGEKNDPHYLFTDIRAARPHIPGTIARGNLETDSEYFTGIQTGAEVTVKANEADIRTSLQDEQKPADEKAVPVVPEPNWVTVFPEVVTVDQQLLKRGHQRFDIYCSACHGYSGNGDGLVNQRAMALNATGDAAWTTAKSLHDPEVKKQPVGRIFDTITNGRTTMGPYRDQIPVADRWAIVAYVKALQETGIEPPVTAVPEGAEPNPTEPAAEDSDENETADQDDPAEAPKSADDAADKDESNETS